MRQYRNNEFTLNAYKKTKMTCLRIWTCLIMIDVTVEKNDFIQKTPTNNQFDRLEGMNLHGKRTTRDATGQKEWKDTERSQEQQIWPFRKNEFTLIAPYNIQRELWNELSLINPNTVQYDRLEGRKIHWTYQITTNMTGRKNKFTRMRPITMNVIGEKKWNYN